MNSGRAPTKQPENGRRRTGSLRRNLILWNIAVLAVMLGIFGAACRVATLSVMMISVNDELARGIRMYIRPPRFGPPGMRPGPQPPGAPPDEMAGPRNDGPPGPPPPGQAEGRDRGAPPGMMRPPDAGNPNRPHLYAVNGSSAMSDDRVTWDPAGLARALNGETVYSNVTVDDEPLRVLSAPGFLPDGRRGAVQYAYPLKDLYRALAGVTFTLLMMAPFGLAGAGYVGVALTNRVLKRVHLMTRAAGEIGAESLGRRLPVAGNDEFSELAETFNGMLSGLDESFRQQQELVRRQQQFTADASHELKTPLTIIKGRASMGLERPNTDDRSRHAFREIETAAIRMERLVQDLLLLARLDDGGPARRDAVVPVAELLESAAQQAVCSEPSRIHIACSPGDLTMAGDESELARLVRNLLDNALAYSPEDLPVEVSALKDEGQVVIRVQDYGTGIGPEHLARIGERFYRVDESRTRPTGGTGLGLSICKSIAAAHGGSLSIDSEPGKGTTVTVRFGQASDR